MDGVLLLKIQHHLKFLRVVGREKVCGNNARSGFDEVPGPGMSNTTNSSQLDLTWIDDEIFP